MRHAHGLQSKKSLIRKERFKGLPTVPEETSGLLLGCRDWYCLIFLVLLWDQFDFALARACRFSVFSDNSTYFPRDLSILPHWPEDYAPFPDLDLFPQDLGLVGSGHLLLPVTGS